MRRITAYVITLLFIFTISTCTAIKADAAGLAAPRSTEMIKAALLEGNENGRFDPAEISYTEVGALVQRIANQTPAIQYYDGGTISSNGAIHFRYSIPTDQVKANQAALQKKADQVLASIIKPGQTELEKVKAIHDYLALHTEYDTVNFENKTLPAESYSAHGALVTGIAVCDGYTKAAQLLLDRLGIENEYVSGTAGGQPHSWNLVKIGGQPYFMDITWDDPIPDRKGYVRYQYFLTTSAELRKDHAWNESGWPSATSSKFAFYRDFDRTVEIGGMYYYSSRSDSSRLYKINKDGTGKQRISSARAPYFVIDSDWIYFSNYSNSGYLSKMHLDGSGLSQLNKIHSTDLAISGRTLTFIDHATGRASSMALPKTVQGVKAAADKIWTVTFNTAVDFGTVNAKTVRMTDESGNRIPVTYRMHPSDPAKLLVLPPAGNYGKHHNYTMTIEQVRTPAGKVMKQGTVHLFHVE